MTCIQYKVINLILTASIIAALLPALVTAEDAIDAVSKNISAGSEGALPAGFSNDGIYGCAGGGYGSVGLAHATGVFVPVSEDAVAQNTHTLLYKECILDAITIRAREAAIAAMVKASLKRVNQGPDGKPQFITDPKKYKLELSDEEAKKFLQDHRTDVLFEPFRQSIREGLMRDYAKATHRPEDFYKSTVPADKKESYMRYYNGGKFKWDMFMLSAQPQNNMFGAYTMSLNQMVTDIDETVANRFREADWADGFKSQRECRQIPIGNGRYKKECSITTPGSVIASITNYTTQTGMRQVENADEIDELVGSLMSNISTQILTSVGGLRGISQSTSDAPSYLDRIMSDAAQRARGAYTSAGSGLLDGALATELSYSAARKSSKESLELTIAQIKNKELSCWDDLIAQAKTDITKESEEKACIKAGSGGTSTVRDEDGNCLLQGSVSVQESEPKRTHPNGVTEDSPLDIISTDVTITAKTRNETVKYTLVKHNKNSLTTIARQIAPLLKVVDKSIASSNKALSVLTTLQASLASSSSDSNTRFVLEQIDQLVQAKALHKESDVYTAQEQSTQIASTMERMYSETAEVWDATWCKPSAWRAQIKK